MSTNYSQSYVNVQGIVEWNLIVKFSSSNSSAIL